MMKPIRAVILTVAVVLAVLWLFRPHTRSLQWDHDGTGVSYWRVCAPDCQTVTPKVVAVKRTVKTFRVDLPRRAKPPYRVEACNEGGCGTAELRKE